MPIQANVTNNQISASVGETQIDVNVSGGLGPTGSAGPSGTIAVSSPITNAGTSTAAVIGLATGTGLEVTGGALAVQYGTTSSVACRGSDARLSDSREWSAPTVTQAEAEAGASTDRRAFTPLRVFQAIAAWWAGSAAKTKLDGIASGATANQTDAYLLSRANHTGTQLASTISDFTTAVIAAAPPTTNASLLVQGTLPDARLSNNIARTSDVSSAVAALVNSAPATLDTLAELASALGSDANFSTTVTNALAAKAPINNPTFTGTVGGITKGMVGLGNVDNTSDAAKPVSTAQAAADSAVASAAAADATSKANAAQAAAVQRANHTGTQAIGTVDGLQTALDGKASLSHAHSAADVTSGTFNAARIPSLDSSKIVLGTSGTLSIGNNAGDFLASLNSSTLQGAIDALGQTIDANAISGLATSATTDTTNAGNISSGTLAAARIGSHATTHNPGGADAVSLVEVFDFLVGSRPATATGSAGIYSWTVPAAAKYVTLFCHGAGAGGGSGRRGAAGTARCGGGGGGAGGWSELTYRVEDLPSLSLAIQVTAGGAGGAAVATDNTDGHAGSHTSQNTSVSAAGKILCLAWGASRGMGGGSAATASGGDNWWTSLWSPTGSTSSGRSAAAGDSSSLVSYTASRGGGGGGADAAGNSYAGGAGGGAPVMLGAASGPAGGSAGGGAGSAGTSWLRVGGGGGGGGGNAGGAGGSGGNGAFPGGGGGGGGASANGSPSGKGGNGGDGVVRITVWY